MTRTYQNADYFEESNEENSEQSDTNVGSSISFLSSASTEMANYLFCIRSMYTPFIQNYLNTFISTEHCYQIDFTFKKCAIIHRQLYFFVISFITSLSFYRLFNGILGGYDTNNQSISLRLMQIDDIGDEEDAGEISMPYDAFLKLGDILDDPIITLQSFNVNVETVLGACHRVGMNMSELDYVSKSFRLNWKLNVISSLSTMVLKATGIAVGKQVFAKHSYRGGSPYSYVIARWNGENGEVSFRPSIIRDFFKVKANLENDEQKCF